jgi:hypothetical protein
MDNKFIELQKCGFTCLECSNFPCQPKQELEGNISPICLSFKEVECKYFECPYTNPVCYLYCK